MNFLVQTILLWITRIQSWLEKDISLISSDLLIIGREVETAYGGFIDLLCLDRNGDVVIVELKRDKTPRSDS
jgi:RecB family endonuclease NucS